MRQCYWTGVNELSWLSCLGPIRVQTLNAVRTDTSPFPPLVSPSFRPLGCLFIVSRLFCWYSSSIVMAATPFAMAPVILEAAPAIPPGWQMYRTDMEEWLHCVGYIYLFILTCIYRHSFGSYLQLLQPELSPREPFLQQTLLAPGWLPGNPPPRQQKDNVTTAGALKSHMYVKHSSLFLTNIRFIIYIGSIMCISIKCSFVIKLDLF